MSKTKTHRTVTITAKMLERLGACTCGLEAIRPCLPIKISTDPEENFEVAEMIVCSERARDGWYDAGWLAGCFELDPYPDNDHYLKGKPNPDARCIYVVAQQLAMAADGIVTKAGR